MPDLDKYIDYEGYYTQHIAKAKRSGDQLTGLCPFHEDHSSSFGANLKDGKCRCYTGCGKWNVTTFHAKLKGIDSTEAYKELCSIYNVPSEGKGSGGGGKEPARDIKTIPIETLNKFKDLSRGEGVLEYILEKRGWSEEIIEKHKIGYHPQKKRLTIPIFDDLGNLVNIRLYKPKASENKMVSWGKGFGEARLHPLKIIHQARIEDQILYLVEGEPDCLCGLSRGLFCLTQTAGADTWKDEWNPRLKGLHIRIAYDNDVAGRAGMLKVIRHLPAFAAKVECIQWPEIMVGDEEKGDLTDWFMKHGKTREEFEAPENWISVEEFKTKYGGAGGDGKDGKEDPIQKAIQELNERHAIIMLGGKCLILNEVIDPVFDRPDITFSAPSDFRMRYENKKLWVPNGNGKTKATSVANIWLEHPERKEYDNLVFSPGKQSPANCYNLYRGMAFEPRKGSWEKLQEHIFNVVCQKDPSIFRYLMAWMADAVQNPGGDRAGVSVVCKGGKGVGKGIVFRSFGELFGGHFVHVEHQSQLVGKFNQHLKDALIVFADECFFAGDKQAEATIKRIITEPTIRIEPKGKESFSVKNYMRLLIASNESWVVPAGIQERRFLVLDVKNPFLDKMSKYEYFHPIIAEIENGGREAMLYDLLNHKYDPKTLLEAPKTEALLSQIEEGMGPECKFWYHRLKEGTILREHDSWHEDFVQSEKIYAQYVDFSQKLGKIYLASPELLSRKLREFCPCIIPTRGYVSVTKQARGLKCSTLKACRTAFEKSLGQTVDWDCE